MEFSIKQGSPEKLKSGCVVVGVFEGGKLSTAAQVLDKAAKHALSDLIARGDMSGKVRIHPAAAQTSRHRRRARVAGRPGQSQRTEQQDQHGDPACHFQCIERHARQRCRACTSSMKVSAKMLHGSSSKPCSLPPSRLSAPMD